MFSKMYLACIVIGVIFYSVNVTVKCNPYPPPPDATKEPHLFPPDEQDDMYWQPDQLEREVTTVMPPPSEYTKEPPRFPPGKMDEMSWQPDQLDRDLTNLLPVLPKGRKDLNSTSTLEGRVTKRFYQNIGNSSIFRLRFKQLCV